MWTSISVGFWVGINYWEERAFAISNDDNSEIRFAVQVQVPQNTYVEYQVSMQAMSGILPWYIRTCQVMGRWKEHFKSLFQKDEEGAEQPDLELSQENDKGLREGKVEEQWAG